MRTWIIRITPWLDEDRKLDKPYQYEIAAEHEHTAVHRAMMAFHEEVGRYHSFRKLTSEVERVYHFGPHQNDGLIKGFSQDQRKGATP